MSYEYKELCYCNVASKYATKQAISEVTELKGSQTKYSMALLLNQF